MNFDLAIVGGGPAGASAAIFSARAGFTTVVIDADKGFTRRAMLHNYLGFPAGVTGPDLVDNGRLQARQFGAEWLDATVASAAGGDAGFVLTLEDGSTVSASHVILATGRSVKLAEELGVTTEPNSDGKSSHIVVDREGRTNVSGVWAAGYATGLTMHAIVTAGDGARVGINLISEVRGTPLRDHDVLPAPTA